MAHYGLARDTSADGLRLPTDALVVQLKARVRDLEVALFCTVFMKRDNTVVEKWQRQGGHTPKKSRSEDGQNELVGTSDPNAVKQRRPSQPLIWGVLMASGGQVLVGQAPRGLPARRILGTDQEGRAQAKGQGRDKGRMHAPALQWMRWHSGCWKGGERGAEIQQGTVRGFSFGLHARSSASEYLKRS